MSVIILNAEFKTAVFAILYSSSVFMFLIGHEVLWATASRNTIPHKDANSRSAHQETTPPATEPEGSLSYSKIFLSYPEA
jgi:hypothetical protein